MLLHYAATTLCGTGIDTAQLPILVINDRASLFEIPFTELLSRFFMLPSYCLSFVRILFKILSGVLYMSNSMSEIMFRNLLLAEPYV